jgi:hypothetical protein
MRKPPDILVPLNSSAIFTAPSAQDQGSLEDLAKVERRHRRVKTASRFERDATDIEVRDIHTRQVRLGASKQCRSDEDHAWSTGRGSAFQIVPRAARQKSRTRENP